MAAPRYVPRDFCAEPESFGKAREVQWLPVTDERSDALSRAARLQHMYAVRIRARAKAIARGEARAIPNGSYAVSAMVEGEPPLKTLARMSGTNYVRLLRCLRGVEVLRLDDIAWADVVLGEISEQARARAAVQAQQRAAVSRR